MDPSNHPNSATTVRGEPRRLRRRLGVWAIPAGVLGLAVGVIVYGVVRTPPAPPPRPKKLAGASQEGSAAKSDEAGVTWACADEIDDTGSRDEIRGVSRAACRRCNRG